MGQLYTIEKGIVCADCIAKTAHAIEKGIVSADCSAQAAQTAHALEFIKASTIGIRYISHDRQNVFYVCAKNQDPKIIKKSMLNSAEHKVLPAHKCKMPTIVGI